MEYWSPLGALSSVSSVDEPAWPAGDGLSVPWRRAARPARPKRPVYHRETSCALSHAGRSRCPITRNRPTHRCPANRTVLRRPVACCLASPCRSGRCGARPGWSGARCVSLRTCCCPMRCATPRPIARSSAKCWTSWRRTSAAHPRRRPGPAPTIAWTNSWRARALAISWRLRASPRCTCRRCCCSPSSATWRTARKRTCVSSPKNCSGKVCWKMPPRYAKWMTCWMPWPRRASRRRRPSTRRRYRPRACAKRCGRHAHPLPRWIQNSSCRRATWRTCGKPCRARRGVPG